MKRLMLRCEKGRIVQVSIVWPLVNRRGNGPKIEKLGGHQPRFILSISKLNRDVVGQLSIFPLD